MATIQSALGSYLRSIGGITALIGQQLFPVRAPDGIQGDYAVYRFTERQDLNVQNVSIPDSYSPTDAEAKFEIITVSANYDTANAIAEAFRTALTGYIGLMPSAGTVTVKHCLLARMRDDEAAEFGLFEVVSEYDIMFQLS